MKTKQKSKRSRHLAAVKAWKTRRSKKKFVRCSCGSIQKRGQPCEFSDVGRETAVGRKSKKQIRHIAAIRAWETRRKNNRTSTVKRIEEAVDCARETRRGKAYDKNARKRHLAAKKAWITRRKNKKAQVDHIDYGCPICEDTIDTRNAQVIEDLLAVAQVIDAKRHSAAKKAWRTRRKNQRKI